MTEETRSYSIAQMRRLLRKKLDDPSLDAFCQDHFLDVFDAFGRGQRKDEKITLLLDHCRRDADRWRHLEGLVQQKLEISQDELPLPPKPETDLHEPSSPSKPETDPDGPLPPDGTCRWKWFVGGFAVSVVIVIVSFKWIRCLVEYRLTEAVVTLLVALVGVVVAVLAGILLPKIREELWSAGGGVALALALGVLATCFWSSPTQAECFPTSTPTPTSTPCPTPHPTIEGIAIQGAITITHPTGDCLEVGKEVSVEIAWERISDGVAIWVLVYSPVAHRYYPYRWEDDPPRPSGQRHIDVTFQKPERYDVVAILADEAASRILEEKRGTGVKEDEMPAGIEENDRISVARTR